MPQLSPPELSILSDERFFRHKARVDAKITAHFTELKQDLEAATTAFAGPVPEALLRAKGRLYRGENWNGLPWRAVDFPRCIDREGAFVYRGLLIWGRHFSFHLLLTGKWAGRMRPALCAAADRPRALGLRLSRQESPWDWRLDAESHLPPDALDADALRRIHAQCGFIKLSVAFPLTDYLSAHPDAGLRTWEGLLPCLFP